MAASVLRCLGAVSWGHVVFRASGAFLVCDFSIVTIGRTSAVASTAALGRPSASGLIVRAISWASPTALRSAAPKLAATSSKRMLGAPALCVMGGGQLRCKRLDIDCFNPDPVFEAFEVFLVVRQQRRDALDRHVGSDKQRFGLLSGRRRDTDPRGAKSHPSVGRWRNRVSSRPLKQFTSES